VHRERSRCRQPADFRNFRESCLPRVRGDSRDRSAVRSRALETPASPNLSFDESDQFRLWLDFYYFALPNAHLASLAALPRVMNTVQLANIHVANFKSLKVNPPHARSKHQETSLACLFQLGFAKKAIAQRSPA
jgi:hypothetical protein